MANRLQSEKSPYLLQHKDNPVDWYPWSAEAFEAAAREDKPVFLSIGYSTCHWCHVMAHESFEDDDIADMLRDFVCIKVDREERPDIDAVYMDVCQALNGSGGWPLTVLMTPEQKPFFAGTYFPKKSRHGQTGLTELLNQTKKLWDNDRERLINAGNQITDMLTQSAEADASYPDKAILKRAYELFKRSFDANYGGFGSAPKFPTPHNLSFLLRYYLYEKEPDSLRMVQKTLNAMAKGGIFDQIGGGFSRYSTDEKWLVPHFEKMLYDNALLISAYLEAYQLTGNEYYASIARRTADYILRDLTDTEGGFYCGQDADSNGKEGMYYTFTPDEVKRVLGQDKGAEFCRIYGITEMGNFEGKSIPNLIGREATDIKADHALLEALYQYRKERVALHRDDKLILSWNAWTIIALAQAGLILNDERYLSAATAAARFIAENMTDERDRLLHRFRDGEAAHSGQLDDYAVYALALLELYRITLDAGYMKRAIDRAEQAVCLFEDEARGGYYLSAHDAERLIARPKELYDGAIPSGNSVMTMVLGRIASLTGSELWRERHERQLRYIGGRIRDYPAGYSFSMLAVADFLYPRRELICAAREMPTELREYRRSNPAHDIDMLFKSPQNEALLAEIAPFTANYPLPDKGERYYLCENGACQAPVDDFGKLQLSINDN